MPDPSASEQIDAIVRDLGGWRGRRLAELRAVINEADASLVEEVKWKKPSNPAGVPVWSRDGIVCVADALKNAVRLTFPKGAAVTRSAALFNARLDGNAARAIDFNETDAVDAGALTALINEAVALNTAKARKA